MDLNSRLFDSIRIKPSCDEPKAAADTACEAPGCTNPGLYRAPKGRKAEGQYYRFCMDHVRAYNASYNYFDGMNDAAVQAFQKDALIGHRPTWAMGVNRTADAKPEQEAGRDWPMSIRWASCAPTAWARRAGAPSRRSRSGPAARPPCARRSTCSASTTRPTPPRSRRSTRRW
jgi:hypothetical protein